MKQKRSSGFTLVEIMVTTCIIGLVVPSILSLYLLFTKIAIDGSTRIEASQNGRIAIVKLRKIVNMSTSNISISDGGAIVRLHHWNNVDYVYEPVYLWYNYELNEIQFQDIIGEGTVTLCNDVYPVGTNAVFSYSSDYDVRCRFFVGDNVTGSKPVGLLYDFTVDAKNTSAGAIATPTPEG